MAASRFCVPAAVLCLCACHVDRGHGADSDVVVNGWIVIAKGAPGQGEVISVDRAASHGHAGNLGLKFDYIYGVDGKKIRLTATNKTQEGDQRGGASSTATVTSTLLLGPVGLFAHNWVKGRDVTIDSSRTLDAFVDSTVHIAATTRGLDSAIVGPCLRGATYLGASCAGTS